MNEESQSPSNEFELKSRNAGTPAQYIDGAEATRMATEEAKKRGFTKIEMVEDNIDSIKFKFR